MKTKRGKAIDNNHGIYEAVFQSWGLGWNKNASIWYSTGKTPPLNSNLVTRTPGWKPDETFAKIDALCEAEGWEGWSIKDSFRVLNLEEYGFTVLFDSQWLYLDAAEFLPLPAGPGLSYTIVDDAHTLSLWKTAWEKNNTVKADAIYRDAILEDPSMFFVVGRDGAGEVTSLCLLNKTDDVVGISNFYPPHGNVVAHWSDLIAFIQREFGETDVVGYERPELLSVLKPLGVEAVGDLCIWVKAGRNETARF